MPVTFERQAPDRKRRERKRNDPPLPDQWGCPDARQAKAAGPRDEDRPARLKAQYEANEKKLAELEEAKLLKAGSLGEMIGVVRQVAGDSAARFRRSIVTAQ